MLSISIIYSSAGGHAKAAAMKLSDALVKATVLKSLIIDKRSAGTSRAEDLLDADVLVLVSSEQEGKRNLSEKMRTFLFEEAVDIDLDGRCIACVSLSGDEETVAILIQKFQEFIDAQNGKLFAPHLLLDGKNLAAYDDEIAQWTHALITHLAHRETRKPLAKFSSSSHSI